MCIISSVGSLTGRNGKGVYVYFVANFSKEPVSLGTWSDGHLSLNVSAAGKHCGAFAGNSFNYRIVGGYPSTKDFVT